MIPRLVLDTNVIISALRSRRGPAFKLLSLVGTSRFELCLSVPLLLEYEEVLARDPPLVPLPAEAIGQTLDYLCRAAVLQEIYFLWRPVLPDPRDDLVLEVAVASRCTHLVTFNRRHFGPAKTFELKVVSPGTMLKDLGDL